MQKSSTGWISSRRSGVSIVEVLVAVGVVSVLLSLAFPALLNARARTAEVVSMARTRSIAGDMQAYADMASHWPEATSIDAFPSPISVSLDREDFDPGVLILPWWPQPLHLIADSPWDMALLWPALLSLVTPWEQGIEIWISPGQVGGSSDNQQDGASFRPYRTSYQYSNSSIASPRLWAGAAGADESLIAPTKPSDVAFPANKVLVWDGDLAYLPRPPRRVDGHWLHPTPMAFADGHAAVHTPADAAAGVANPLNNNIDTRLHNTPDGVLGRDY